MSENVKSRIEGSAGFITLSRTEALNALTIQMVRAIRFAVSEFNRNPDVHLILIEAEGDRAFCAGGDLSAIYRAGLSGDFQKGQAFWAEEYRMNLEIATSTKPVVSFMQGFVMGGGIGLGCHAALRIADPDATFAVSQVRIGLAPDAGASFLLSLAPGRMGEYLGATGERFTAADAVWLGFADRILPLSEWSALKKSLSGGEGLDAIPAGVASDPPLQTLANQVDAQFAGESLADIWRALLHDESPFGEKTRKHLLKVSPLAASAAIETLHRLGNGWSLDRALGLEYRFAYRAQEQGDLLEGIRALIIDKDHCPQWLHKGPDKVASFATARMLLPLGYAEWSIE